MIDRQGIPEVVLALAPLMRELLQLRKENQDLRYEKRPPEPGWDTLLPGTPFSVTQAASGKWDFGIVLADDYRTGGSGYGTARDAIQAALCHVADLWRHREAEVAELYEDNE